MRVLCKIVFSEVTTTQAPFELNSRIDAPAMVSGSPQYAADINRPGMLVGAVLRSPLAHAEIVEIDASVANAITDALGASVAFDLPITAEAVTHQANERS